MIVFYFLLIMNSYLLLLSIVYMLRLLLVESFMSYAIEKSKFTDLCMCYPNFSFTIVIYITTLINYLPYKLSVEKKCIERLKLKRFIRGFNKRIQ